MTFICTTTGGWVNLNAVTLIGPGVRDKHGYDQHEIRGGEDGRAFIGHVFGPSLAAILTDTIPAPAGWRVLRAGQNEEGDWRVVSVVPVIAFGRGLEGLWQPLPADFLLDRQIANPTAMQHDSGTQVFDIAHAHKFDNTGSWLAHLTGHVEGDDLPAIMIDAHRGHEDEPWRLRRMDLLRRILMYNKYDQTETLGYTFGAERVAAQPKAAVASIYDHKGILTVTWTEEPTPDQKEDVERFWENVFGESATEHEIQS